MTPEDKLWQEVGSPIDVQGNTKFIKKQEFTTALERQRRGILKVLNANFEEDRMIRVIREIIKTAPPAGEE